MQLKVKDSRLSIFAPMFRSNISSAPQSLDVRPYSVSRVSSENIVTKVNHENFAENLASTQYEAEKSDIASTNQSPGSVLTEDQSANSSEANRSTRKSK